TVVHFHAIDWQFFAMPLRLLARHDGTSAATLIAALACLLIVAWALAALAFRRAADADISAWVAAFAMGPIIQIPTILALCVLPSRSADPSRSAASDERASEWVASMQGMVAGAGLTLAAVAVGALLFGSYGYGMFMVSPFVIG